MSAMVMNLIIQLITGAIGGNAAGAAAKSMSLGPVGNTIAGAVGGLGGGQLLALLMPTLTTAMGSPDMNAMLGQIVAGGAGGAILTGIVGFIKNAMGGQASS
ncbi:MAG TPA: hypothetical protein VL026_01420 [Rhizomicrobium sp.]|nr:hypothetical protein [Rhizomicrobium sp.]